MAKHRKYSRKRSQRRNKSSSKKMRGGWLTRAMIRRLKDNYDLSPDDERYLSMRNLQDSYIDRLLQELNDAEENENLRPDEIRDLLMDRVRQEYPFDPNLDLPQPEDYEGHTTEEEIDNEDEQFGGKRITNKRKAKKLKKTRKHKRR